MSLPNGMFRLALLWFGYLGAICLLAIPIYLYLVKEIVR